MTTTLSTKGQVVLPNMIRKKLGLRPGTRFSCVVRDAEIVLKPLLRPSGKARIVTSRVTGLPVIVPPAGSPPLTPEAVSISLADFP
jgi:AbrB family looped-hinge helix DNA binding protein